MRGGGGGQRKTRGCEGKYGERLLNFIHINDGEIFMFFLVLFDE